MVFEVLGVRVNNGLEVNNGIDVPLHLKVQQNLRQTGNSQQSDIMNIVTIFMIRLLLSQNFVFLIYLLIPSIKGDHDFFAQERDKAQKGVISYDQLVEIFRIYEVPTTIILSSSSSSPS